MGLVLDATGTIRKNSFELFLRMTEKASSPKPAQSLRELSSGDIGKA